MVRIVEDRRLIVVPFDVLFRVDLDAVYQHLTQLRLSERSSDAALNVRVRFRHADAQLVPEIDFRTVYKLQIRDLFPEGFVERA